MKAYLQNSIAFFILALLISSIFAYQGPNSKPSASPQTVLDLEKQKTIAENYVNESNWDAAIKVLGDAQQKCRQQGLLEDATNLYEELFSVTILRDDWEETEKLYLLAKHQEIEKDNILFQPIYYAALSHYYIYHAQVDSSEYYYEKACQEYQIQQRPQLEASLNLVLAIEWYFLDDLQTANHYLQKAEQIIKKHQIILSNLYNIQSIIYNGLGDFDKALAATLKSIELVEKNSDISPIDLAIEYNNLASIYGTLKDNKNAFIYYDKAIKLVEPTGHYLISSYLYNIGATLLQQQEYQEAAAKFSESISYLDLEIEKTPNVLSDYINNYLQLAACYQNFGKLDSMLYYIQQAEKINKISPYRIASTYSRYGDYYSSNKDYTKAVSYYKQALSKATEAYGAKGDIISGIYNNLTTLETERNNPSQALFYCQKGLESISIDFSDEQGISNPKLENVLQLGALLQILKTKLSILKNIYTNSAETTETIKTSDIFASAKLATECMAQINRSMKNIDSKREWLTQNAIPLFEDAIELALNIAEKTKDNRYLNEAFMLCEHSKSMLLTDANQESNASNLGGVPDSLLDKSKELQQVLTLAEKKRFDAHLMGDTETEKIQQDLIFAYKHDLDALKYTFEQKYPKYYSLKYESKVASIQDIQAILDEKTSFIEYFEGAEKIYVFSIHSKSATADIIKKENTFELNIYNFQLLLTDINRFLDKPTSTYNEFTRESSKLYNKFIKKSLTEKVNRLIIVPDGQLNYLPFEVLLSNKIEPLSQGSKEANFAILPYLINDYMISYNYSGTFLIAQQAAQKKENNGNILALAPSYSSKEVPSWRGEREVTMRKDLIELPGAVEEVDKLKKLFEGRFHTEKEANETLFKKEASKYGILHLAMHGLVNKSNPDFSGLAFSEDQSKAEDNFLYAYEIKQLALNSNLVVLSACETGIGKYQRGEGVVSIGRSFMYAGTPALLMTLWSLNDQSGALIIESFYKNLSIGMQKDAAIRQAKLDYLAQSTAVSAHPFLWAAFVQVGDYSSIPINNKSSSWWWYALAGLGVFILGFIIIKSKKKEKYV